MAEVLIKQLGVKVGLEIHQQLDTKKKLFCNCTPIESDNHTTKFFRKLRVSKSELGEFDPAALFESTKSKTITYFANSQSSCLVEQDEEPPHDLDKDAKKITLIISSILKSNIFTEIYPMRKTVIDGSNTTGFQRTMLISQGGFYNVGKLKIGIQSICLEEDAAKILGEKNSEKQYGLERLGVPLVEIATEPFEVELEEIRKIAQTLGRILRSTKKVKRGLGSIRQDVNVSIKDGGVVIEVKGVQQLDQLEKVVEYEAKRQDGLLKISNKIRERNWTFREDDIKDITEIFVKCKSKIIQNSIKKDHEIFVIAFRNLAELFGYSPYNGVRLGKDVAELVRFFGIGGVFHSDELPNYGIEDTDIKEVNKILKLEENDAFLILATPKEKTDVIINQIILRIEYIRDKGIPIDTRLATQTGETKFLRPRPGAARMYPETDIPPITVTDEEFEEASKEVPKSWDESINEIVTKFKMSPQLAEQIFDSKYNELFERIVKETKSDSSFVASILCSSIIRLERSGLNSNLLKNEDILKSFQLLRDGKIAKESIEIIFEHIMSGKSGTVEETLRNTSIGSLQDAEVESIIIDIIENNQEIIRNQKKRAIGPLMGITMKKLRGKASGEMVNKLLVKNINKELEKM